MKADPVQPKVNKIIYKTVTLHWYTSWSWWNEAVLLTELVSIWNFALIIVLSNAISGRQPGSGEDAIHTSVIWIREIILLAVGMCGIFIDVSRVIGLKKKKRIAQKREKEKCNRAWVWACAHPGGPTLRCLSSWTSMGCSLSCFPSSRAAGFSAHPRRSLP